MSAVHDAVQQALAEDLGPPGDITTALLADDLCAHAQIRARQAGRQAGRVCADEAFRQVDPAVQLDWSTSDGDPLEPGQVLAEVSGPLAGILTAERTALNFLSHLSGIASETARYVAAAAGGGARIWDTRKTTPGLRALEKAAVRAGGAWNHRSSLSDWVMLKDNHLQSGGWSVAEAVAAARRRWPGRTVHVECDRVEQADEALAAGADALLLDNMDLAQVAACVELAAGQDCLLEVSGGMTLDRVADYAASGVDFISVGRITNSAPVLDIGLDMVSAEAAVSGSDPHDSGGGSCC